MTTRSYTVYENRRSICLYLTNVTAENYAVWSLRAYNGSWDEHSEHTYRHLVCDILLHKTVSMEDWQK